MQTLLVAALIAAILPSPSPAPAPATKTLQEIGRVRAATPYCSTFYQYYNGAVRPLLANDGALAASSETLVNITLDFRALDGELRMTRERIALGRYVDAIQQSVPALQTNINALRRAMNLTTDPERRKEAHDLAEKLQTALDHQHQLALDLTGVVHVLMDIANKPGFVDMFAQNLQDASSVSSLDALSVKSYLKWDKQIDKIDAAEGQAATLALSIADKC